MNLTKPQQKYLLISVGVVSAIVIIVAVTITIVYAVEASTIEAQKQEIEQLTKTNYKDISKLPINQRIKLRQKHIENRQNVKYAFVYSGQPRTWKQAIPTW